MAKQQKQAQHFFRATSGDWQKKATGDHPKFNVIQGRNQVVLRVLEKMESPGPFLDVGCGTGQLVVSAAQAGIESVGVDFADEMIETCRTNGEATGVTADFIHASIFEYLEDDREFGSVSMMGLIEYLPLEETDALLACLFNRLRDDGRVLVGSRNRLFNTISFNGFTRMEERLEMLEPLIRQSVILMDSESQEEALRELQAFGDKPEPQPTTHPRTTGIEVEARFQFSPADLMGRLSRAGFKVRRIHPVHFHGLPLFLKAARPDVHVEMAELADSLAPGDHRLVPYSSTFVMEAGKPK